jgi:hypothetical protein
MRSLLILTLLAAPAVAEPTHGKTAEAMHTDDCARAHKLNKECVLDMGTETVEGDVKSPDGKLLLGFDATKQPSLIRLRKEFIVEILKSAEDL